MIEKKTVVQEAMAESNINKITKKYLPIIFSIHPWQEPSVQLEKNLKREKAFVSIVMPIYNQSNKIINVLKSLVALIYYPFHLVLIDDASSDGTVEILKEFFRSPELMNSKCIKYTLIINETPVYETACDNMGFRVCDTEYIIEIQADITIKEYGFDKKMIVALDMFNLGTISGRLVHPFAVLDDYRAWKKYPLWKCIEYINKNYQCVGLMGERIFTNNPVNVSNSQSIYIGETNARGPWILRRSDLVLLDYLDEKNFFLGNDDHDYNRRIYERLGKKAGYIPIEQVSFESDGSTRKVRTGKNLEIFNYLKNEKKGSPVFNYFIKNYKPYLKLEKVPFSLSKADFIR